jgi:hypothetical protein
MMISSRTPEGQPNRCPICRTACNVEPSNPAGDAPCPLCGHLLWFARDDGQDVRPACDVFSPRWSVPPARAVAMAFPGPGSSAERVVAAGDHRDGFSGLTDVAQYVCSWILIVSIALIVILWALNRPHTAMHRTLTDVVSLVGGLALIVFFFARPASLFAQRWAQSTQRRVRAGSKSGGLWDRELDG